MERNIKALTNKGYKIEPLYTESDVYLTMNRTVAKEKQEIHKLNDFVSYQFVEAGHILGSVQLVLYIKTLSGSIKKIHITSDLGSNMNKQPFVNDKDIVTSSSVSIFEATYNDLERGFKSKSEVQKERMELRNLIKNELDKNHRVLLPCFAQGRTQNIMIFLYECFKNDENFNTPIYIDGKLSLEINNIYQSLLEGEDKEYWREVMSWKYFNYIGDYEKSISVALNKDKKIVISSGGMCSQGRIVNHIKSMIEDRDSTIITIGYMGEGTVGHEIQRVDNKVVKIEGMEYRKKCRVCKMDTWSSHIQTIENIKYMSQIKTSLIILHHSDNEEKFKFRDIVENELRLRNNSAKISCASEDNNIFYI